MQNADNMISVPAARLLRLLEMAEKVRDSHSEPMSVPEGEPVADDVVCELRSILSLDDFTRTPDKDCQVCKAEGEKCGYCAAADRSAVRAGTFKVICIDASADGLTVGQEYTVRAIINEGRTFDLGCDTEGNEIGCFAARRFTRERR